MAGRMPAILQLSVPTLPPDLYLQEDRKAYVASLQAQYSEVAISLLKMSTSVDVDLHHCFLESLISKGAHRDLARLGWKLPVRTKSPNN